MQEEKKKNENIGRRIRELRISAGLSQKELAEKVGYASGMAISHIENGGSGVALSVLPKIAEVLHTTQWYLLGDQASLNKQFGNKNIDFNFALRAAKDLTLDDKRRLMEFYDFIKKNKKK